MPRSKASIVPSGPVASAAERARDGRCSTRLMQAFNRIGLPLCGIAYLCATLSASYQFLLTSSKNLANDFFWAEFNATGSGVYIIQAFNLMLQNPASFNTNEQPMDLSDPVFLLDHRLDGADSQSAFSPMAARMVQYHQLTTIEHGIQSIRLGGGFTQYCWVDFERRWGLAHTLERAERCLQPKYVQNGAMYLQLGCVPTFESTNHVGHWPSDSATGRR